MDRAEEMGVGPEMRSSELESQSGCPERKRGDELHRQEAVVRDFRSGSTSRDDEMLGVS